MKKFLMLSMLICGAMSGAWGAENCNLIKGDAATNVRSDKEAFSANGGVYVCDKDMGADECPYGAVIISGDVVKYCEDQSGYTDTWVSFAESIGACSQADVESYGKGVLKRSGKYLVGTNFKSENGVMVCKYSTCKGGHTKQWGGLSRICKITKDNDDMVACYEAKKRGEPANWNGTSCNCGDQHVWDKTLKRCNKKGSGDTVKCDGSHVGVEVELDLSVCKKTYADWINADKLKECYKKCEYKEGAADVHWVTHRRSCEDGWRPGQAESKEACIKIGGQGTNPGGVGKCHSSVCYSDECKACCKKPKEETIWDRGAQVCHCVNGGHFTKENNQWICKVDNSQPVVPSGQCDNALLALVQGWKTQCAGKTEVLAEIDGLLAYCAGKAVSNDVFLRLYDELKALVDEKCVGSSEQPPHVDDGADRLRVSIRIIRDAHSNLSGMAEGFKVSVWKDDEGKFNTSRLVSDSVAGVVLGTAGGLITSNVVKKNQVENGFEDLKCTIGGQVVADWGDQFRVGIQ